MERKNVKIIAAFPGTGKTYICEKTDIRAIEVEYWKYIKEDEALFKKEYVDVVKEYLKLDIDYIFIDTRLEALKLLRDEGIDIILVYPKNELRNEYLDRYILRDSPFDFIGSYMKYWNIWIDELKDQKYCKQHIILKKGEYLFDVL